MPSQGCAHPPWRPELVSLFIASTVSGTETTLERAPCAPASIARAATLWSRYAVNTSVGMCSAPPLFSSRTRSSPSPSGSLTSMSAASSPPSRSRSRASARERASTNTTSRGTAASARSSARAKFSLNRALSSISRIRCLSIPPSRSRRGPSVSHYPLFILHLGERVPKIAREAI
jgi:hypothetical protein